MFICKSKIMNSINSHFSRGLKGVKIFGFDLDGYGMTRIWLFSERYLLTGSQKH